MVVMEYYPNGSLHTLLLQAGNQLRFEPSQRRRQVG